MSKDSKQWLKVIEIASLIGLSKVTVYKKLKAIDSISKYVYYIKCIRYNVCYGECSFDLLVLH